MRTAAALGLLVVLAAALRLWNLGGPSLWMDEGFTWMVASHRLSEMAAASLFVEKHPPLQYLLVHCMLWWGHSEWYLRLPFALAGTATVLAVFKLGDALYGRGVGLWAAALLAVSSLHVLMSRECRDYAVACLFLTLSAYFWWRRSLVWHFVCGLLAIYSHYFCLVGVGLQWLLKREPPRVWWWVPLGLGVLYLPWVPTMLAQARTPSPGHGAPPWSALVEVLFTQMAGFSLNFRALWVYYLIALLAAATLALALSERSRRSVFVAGIFLGLAGLTILGSMVSGVGLFETKYLVLVAPFFYVLFVAGAMRLPPLSATALLLFTVCINLVSSCNLLAFDEWRQQDWRQVAAVLSARVHAGDLVVVEPHYVQPVLEYYSLPRATFRWLSAAEVERASAKDFEEFRRVWLVRSASLSSDTEDKIGAILRLLSQRQWEWRSAFRRNSAFDVYVTLYWLAPDDRAGGSTTTAH